MEEQAAQGGEECEFDFYYSHQLVHEFAGLEFLGRGSFLNSFVAFFKIRVHRTWRGVHQSPILRVFDLRPNLRLFGENVSGVVEQLVLGEF